MTRMLLVEDSKSLNMALTMRLEHAGYQVMTAHDVEEGFALAMENPPAVAMLDINLPGGSGIELAQRLREHLDLAIVLATANRDPELEKLASESGAAAFLTKPFDTELLLKTVAQAARAGAH